MDIDQKLLDQSEYELENLDVFVSFAPPEFVFTFLIQGQASDLHATDMLLDNPELWLNIIAAQTGKLKDKEVLEDIPEVGDKASGLSIVMHKEGKDFRMQIVVFRRSWVIAFAASMHPEGGASRVSAGDLALLLDERLIAAIDGQ